MQDFCYAENAAVISAYSEYPTRLLADAMTQFAISRERIRMNQRCGGVPSPAASGVAFVRLNLLILAIVVAGRHRHQQRFHPAFALATQYPQAIEELAEILVDAPDALIGRKEEIVQARHGETQ